MTALPTCAIRSATLKKLFLSIGALAALSLCGSAQGNFKCLSQLEVGSDALTISSLGFRVWNALREGRAGSTLISPPALAASLVSLALGSKDETQAALLQTLKIGTRRLYHIEGWQELRQSLVKAKRPRVTFANFVLAKSGLPEVTYDNFLKQIFGIGPLVLSDGPIANQIFRETQTGLAVPQQQDPEGYAHSFFSVYVDNEGVAESRIAYFDSGEERVGMDLPTYRNLSCGYHATEKFALASFLYGPDLAIDYVIPTFPFRTEDVSFPTFLNYKAHLASLEPRVAHLSVPRIEFHYGADLSERFKQIEMGFPFSESADYSPMSFSQSPTPFQLRAITGMSKLTIGSPLPAESEGIFGRIGGLLRKRPEPIQITLNRPFLFIVRRPSDNLILQMGQVTTVGALPRASQTGTYPFRRTSDRLPQ